MKRPTKQLVFALTLFVVSVANEVLAQSTPQQVQAFGWEALTTTSPAVATDGTNRYFAWKGPTNNYIFFVEFTGTEWINLQIVGGSNWTAETSTAPALQYGGVTNTVWLAWKGTSSNKIWFSTWNGTSWANQQVVSGSDPDWTAETSTTPSLTEFVDSPLLAWKGVSGNKIWYTYNLLGTWATQQTLGGSDWTAETTAAPALTVGYAQGLDSYWEGESGDHIWGGAGGFTLSPDSVYWNSQGEISCNANSNVAPAASFFINVAATVADYYNQVVFWKQSSGNSILYSKGCGTVGGSGWSAETNVAPAVANYSDEGYSTAAVLAWENASDNTVWFIDPTTLPGMMVFQVPQLTSFSPASGPAGTQVKITGSSLTQTTKVTFGGVKATFTVDSGTLVTATVPASAKTGKITITTLGGTATSTTKFKVTK